MKLLSFSFLGLCLAGACSAATYTLDLTSTGHANGTHGTLDLGGVQVAAFSDWAFGGPSSVGSLELTDFGLGVTDAPRGRRLGSHDIQVESIFLTFDHAVKLVGFGTHDNTARGEMLNWTSGDGTVEGGFTQADTGVEGQFDFLLTGDLSGTSFFLTSTEGSGTFLSSVTVSSVPLPGSLILAGSALAGLTGLRRLKKR